MSVGQYVKMRGGLLLLLLLAAASSAWSPVDDKTKCPLVKPIRNFDLNQMMGYWYVVEYYASSEEAPEYSCMRGELTASTDHPGVFMKFNYSFTDDPDRELLAGNITWLLPDPSHQSHWVHAEDTYEGIYNTFILDWDETFALWLHCAEKAGSTRYLSSLILSRSISLGPNVISYLKGKLPKYDIDLEYMFPMNQTDCPQPVNKPKPSKKRKNLLKPRRKLSSAATTP